MKTIIALIPLLLCALISGCAHPSATAAEIPYSKTAYEKGKEDARAQLAQGILAVESYGLRRRNTQIYQVHLKEKYGIEDRSVAGCIVTDEILGHAKGFNEVMMAAIHQKWPDDVFEKAHNEALSLDPKSK